MAASRRIGFVSTRFSGTDGVSLETQKWADVLERMGHSCFYFCGESDRPPEVSMVVPEAFYRHPTIDAINQVVYTGTWGKSMRFITIRMILKRCARISSPYLSARHR